MTTNAMTTERRSHNATMRFGPLAVVGAMLVGLLSAGCAREVTTAGEGAVETQTRAIEAFTRIEVSYGIGVTIRIGPAAALEVSAQPNLLPIIATDAQGGTLRIRGTREFATTLPPQVVIVTPSLEGIALSGGSLARIDGLDFDAVRHRTWR